MKIYKKIENNIEYTVIEYDVNPTLDEMVEALDIIHNVDYCKVVYWLDYNPKHYEKFIYYRKGKVHNEFGLAMNDFYGIGGEIVQKSEIYNDVSIFKKQLRKLKLNEIEGRR